MHTYPVSSVVASLFRKEQQRVSHIDVKVQRVRLGVLHVEQSIYLVKAPGRPISWTMAQVESNRRTDTVSVQYSQASLCSLWKLERQYPRVKVCS